MPGGGRGQTELSCWLIYPAKKKERVLFLFSPLFSFLLFHVHLCCSANVDIAHVCTHTSTHCISPYSCVVPLSCQANKDPLFLTGVTFPSEYPASPETLVKLSVYDAKDKTQESVSKHFLLCMCVCVAYVHAKNPVGEKRGAVTMTACSQLALNTSLECRFCCTEL